MKIRIGVDPANRDIVENALRAAQQIVVIDHSGQPSPA